MSEEDGLEEGAPTIVGTGGFQTGEIAETKHEHEERWVEEGLVARGGMGSVVRVWDRQLQRRLAMKRLHPELTKVRGLFVQEARITGRLQHPNIVPVHELGAHDDVPYFTMKLVRGHTFSELLRGSLDERPALTELLEIFVKVCDALSFAHSHGILHRDVKPQNVMVGDFGQVYLMDWGLAEIYAPDRLPSGPERSATMSTTEPRSDVTGTPGYVPPELIGTDRRPDPRTDVFALGVLLYEIVTQKRPFRAGNSLGILLKTRNGDFDKPSDAVDFWIPSGLERIVLKAMAHDPDDRYSTVDQLTKDVKRVLLGEDAFPVERFEPEASIIEQGEPGESVYMILEGTCHVFVENGSGRELVREMGPGEVFGEMALLTDNPRTASVIAATSVRVCVISRSALEQELETLAPWAAALVKSLAARFTEREADLRDRVQSDS